MGIKETRVSTHDTNGHCDAEVRTLLEEVKGRLSALYGGQLAEVVLYGSYARGVARADSDIDVAMVLDQYDRTWLEIERTGPMVAELSLKYGKTISLIPVRKMDWEANQTVLTRSLHREGILVG